MNPQQQSVCVLGAGPAGLITAHTLIQDGYDNVTVFTRDRTPGGVWAAERVYPGLTLNNVHGEFRFSSLPMPLPQDASGTGGRLRGEDLRDYFQIFVDRFLRGKIQYNTEVHRIRRGGHSGKLGWLVTVQSRGQSECQVLYFDKFVLCTGGCSEPNVPAYLNTDKLMQTGFTGPVVHSSNIAPHQNALLDAGKAPGQIVVIGGGKSAQDAASFLARNDRKATMIFDSTDAVVAAPIPLPDFIRKSRFLAIASPYIVLRTRLERFLHATWLGSKITHGIWKFLEWSSLLALGIPSASPLRKTHSIFWATRTNDEGVGGPDRFHGLVKARKIELLAPTRAVGYAEATSPDTVVVVTADGRRIEASAIVLATGYKSSWTRLFDEKTRSELGLDPQPVPLTDEFNYASLENPPKSHSDSSGRHSLIYRGLVPAKNILNRDFAINGATFTTNPGYAYEVSAHWISSYFLGDSSLLQRIPRSVEDAKNECLRYNAWLRKRHPDMLAEINESYSSGLSFWSWPQMTDELLEDMDLPSMRSGGGWFTWPFKVIDLKEIERLHQERAVKRLIPSH